MNLYYLQKTIDGNSFNATTNLLAVGSAPTQILLIKNPSGSGKNVIISKIRYGANPTILSSTAKTLIKVYENPTVSTNGTSITIRNMRVGSLTASVATLYKTPTFTADSATLKFIDMYILPSNSGGVEQTIILEPGNHLALTAECSSAGTDHHFEINWVEESI